MGLPQVQVVDAGQGAAVHADGGHGRKLSQLCQVVPEIAGYRGLHEFDNKAGLTSKIFR
jgi:hypothetical protein